MLTSQIRVQEDAILQAQGLKDHTDKMIIDYEKVKTDLTYHIQKNEELVRELHQTQQRRQNTESEFESMRREFEQFKI